MGTIMKLKKDLIGNSYPVEKCFLCSGIMIVIEAVDSELNDYDSRVDYCCNRCGYYRSVHDKYKRQH